MSDTVVCCTDGSDVSADAIRAGLSLLDRGRWRVRLAISVPEAMLETGGAGMAPGGFAGTAIGVVPSGRDIVAEQERLIDMGRSRALEVARVVGLVEDDVEVLVGSPGPAVVDYLRETEAALAVIGSRGLGGAARLLLGSTSEHLVRHAPCPVLVGGDEVPVEPAGPVVVCVDGSERSVAAGAIAVELFAQDLPVALATVVQAPNVTHREGALGDLEDLGLADEADRILVSAATELGVPDTEFVVLEGDDPADALVDYAASHPVRVLVIGSHGRRAVTRVLLGSVAERLVRRSPALVCVVPRRSQEDVPVHPVRQNRNSSG